MNIQMPKMKKIGLAFWKDRDTVYTLSKETKTGKASSCVLCCKCNGISGLVTISRHTVVELYYQNMTHVDLTEMSHLHVQTNLIGLHSSYFFIY